MVKHESSQIILSLIIIAGLGAGRKLDFDCSYSRCYCRFVEIDFFRKDHAFSCINQDGSRRYQNVECINANVITECCRYLSNEDIYRYGKSDQARYNYVSKMAQLSNHCTKRLLCEQSCKNSLFKVSYFPENVPDNSEAKEFIDAYRIGEAHSCFNKMNNNSLENECENDCGSSFPNCLQDVEKSIKTRLFLKSGREFNLLGLWEFSAEWLVRDEVENLDKADKMGDGIKQAFSLLLERMNRLSSQYEEWEENYESTNLPCESCGEEGKWNLNSPEEEYGKWNSFLRTYNETDKELVESVYEVLSYWDFAQKMEYIREVLENADFESEEWNERGSSGSNVARINFVILQSLLLILIIHWNFDKTI